MVIPEQDFEKELKKISKIKPEDGRYIPSDDDIEEYIEGDFDKYWRYLLWYSEHKPVPKDEDEKRRLKRITKAINKNIEIA